MNDAGISIDSIAPTQFLRRGPGGAAEQLVRVIVANTGEPVDAAVRAAWPDGEQICVLGRLPAGTSTHELYLRERRAPTPVRFELTAYGAVIDTRALDLAPPRHWRVHVVHLSHHDAGYTDLPSNVRQQHVRFLDEAIDLAESTSDYPDDARFRIVIEQAWSLRAFLRHAESDRQARMARLLREGRFELTALFGNMITEVCSHESLLRALYPAQTTARELGIHIVSAEHNDIPGVAWGLCQALTSAGVKLLCPGLPRYYRWGGNHRSFWDAAALLGQEDIPGLLWWEAPDGSRLLLWHGDQGCGGDCRPAMPGLGDRLTQLASTRFPLNTIRWVVTGAARDNSPYIRGYADTVKAWNERWLYPHLVMSTNAKFHADIADSVPGSTPVVRGGLPGQDYPVGVLSTMGATAANRANHSLLVAAERAAAVSSILTGSAWPTETLDGAWEDVLWYDEHTWGHHFPAGPTADASRCEKANHAYRAAALAHDVREKALARIADSVAINHDGIHIVVFNAEACERTDLVSCPFRELDNCGNTLTPVSRDDDPRKCGYLRGVLLGDRSHVNPPPEIALGHFDLIDVETGTRIPWQIDRLDSPLGGEPHAPERTGLAAGGKRLGFFEPPLGLGRALSFIAGPVPAMGYRTYRLVPRKRRPRFARVVTTSRSTIENDCYRVEVDQSTGCMTSLFDKKDKRELVDLSAPHGMGAFIVRDPGGREWTARPRRVSVERRGPLTACLRIASTAHGHPHIETRIALTGGIDRIDLSVHVLKDPTPLLETFVAFPFLAPRGHLRCVEPLCITDPTRDRLPGAFLDRLCVDDGVVVDTGEYAIAWRPLDSPVVSPGRLWPGRISPAHACVPHDLDREPQTDGEIHTGHLYSCLFANNFGTNFAVSQSGEVLFRYRIMSGAVGSERQMRNSAMAPSDLCCMFTERRPNRTASLPPVGGILAIDNSAIRVLAFKRAECGPGYVVRLLNLTAEEQTGRLAPVVPGAVEAIECTATEQDTQTKEALTAQGLWVALQPGELRTIRLV